MNIKLELVSTQFIKLCYLLQHKFLISLIIKITNNINLN